MDYGRLINRAFVLAWRHKVLWILGLFSVAGSSSLNFGDAFSDGEGGQFWNSFNGGFGEYDNLDLETFMPLAGAMLMAMMLIGLVFLVAKFIATPALIDSVNNITRGGSFSLSRSFSRGVDFFWKFLGLFFVELFAIFATVIVCGVIAVILIVTIIGIPVAIALIFFVIYFWFTLFSLAERAIVVRDCSIGDALAEGWTLLKNNFGSTLMIALIYMGFSIAFGIMTFIVWLILGLPIGGVTYAVTSSAVAALIVGILIGLPVSLVIGGFTGTFFSSLYTMYYFELVEPTQLVEPTHLVEPGHPVEPSQPSGHYQAPASPSTPNLSEPPPQSTSGPVDPAPPPPPESTDPDEPVQPDKPPPEPPASG